MQDYGLQTRVARFHNIYGPYGQWHGERDKAPAAICRKVATAIRDGIDYITVWGDGEQTRSFLFVEDCVDAIYKLTMSNFGEPMNIGTDRSIVINDLARMVMEIAGKELNIRNDLSKPQGVRGRNADITLIKQVLKWEPKVTLEDGMERLYKWVSSQVG